LAAGACYQRNSVVLFSSLFHRLSH
jgi:hypothetical protein